MESISTGVTDKFHYICTGSMLLKYKETPQTIFLTSAKHSLWKAYPQESQADTIALNCLKLSCTSLHYLEIAHIR